MQDISHYDEVKLAPLACWYHGQGVDPKHWLSELVLRQKLPKLTHGHIWLYCCAPLELLASLVSIDSMSCPHARTQACPVVEARLWFEVRQPHAELVEDPLVDCECVRHLTLQIAYGMLSLVGQLELLGLLLFLLLKFRLLCLDRLGSAFRVLLLLQDDRLNRSVNIWIFFTLSSRPLHVLLALVLALFSLGCRNLLMNSWSEFDQVTCV